VASACPTAARARKLVEAGLLRSYRRDLVVPLRELREFIDRLRMAAGVQAGRGSMPGRSGCSAGIVVSG